MDNLMFLFWISSGCLGATVMAMTMRVCVRKAQALSHIRHLQNWRERTPRYVACHSGGKCRYLDMEAVARRWRIGQYADVVMLKSGSFFELGGKEGYEYAEPLTVREATELMLCVGLPFPEECSELRGEVVIT